MVSETCGLIIHEQVTLQQLLVNFQGTVDQLIDNKIVNLAFISSPSFNMLLLTWFSSLPETTPMAHIFHSKVFW